LYHCLIYNHKTINNLNLTLKMESSGGGGRTWQRGNSKNKSGLSNKRPL
jgi:hypothetical protein